MRDDDATKSGRFLREVRVEGIYNKMRHIGVIIEERVL
jgi:hypothetical protein